MTQTKRDKAIKKVEIAIDKMIDLQQDFQLSTEQGKYDLERILDMLRSLESKISIY